MADNFNRITKLYDRKEFLTLHDECTFSEYIEKIYVNPLLIRTAHQRIYDMIIAKGTSEYEKFRKKMIHYNFFDEGESRIFGLEDTLDALVKVIKGGASGYGSERRILLLHGPVGSAKSTIAKCLKRGLENYTKTDEGVLYTYKWINLPTGQNGIYTHTEDMSAMHEDPLKLLPLHMRDKVVKEINAIYLDSLPEEKRNDAYTLRCLGNLNPRCHMFMNELLEIHKGDLEKVLNEHIRVVRLVFSESNRIGIGTFQPKDEKNQDATELTGDIDYSKLPHFGSDANPKAFSFNGELCVASRGFVEFIEMLKLDRAFLYDLLGAAQERQIKPKKFQQVDIDELILGHTNNPEFKKLLASDENEAIRDRTIRIDVPYLTTWADEIKVLERDFGKDKVKVHIAPHTLEIVALWTCLTRLEEDGDIDLVKKVKLYNGENMKNFTDDSIKEMKLKFPNEGMKGVSIRIAQDKLSNCLSEMATYINPWSAMNAIEEGLANHSLINKKEDLAKCYNCIKLALGELDNILKDEVRKALTSDENAIVRLCTNYIDNLMAYIKKTKVRNPYTKKDEAHNEKFLRKIEEKIGIPNNGVHDFRMSVSAAIAGLAHEGKKFAWNSNDELKHALEMHLFESVQDSVKISSLHADAGNVVDNELQDKIDAIKKRLIDQYGYNEQSATDVLNYVSSIFVRSDITEKD